MFFKLRIWFLSHLHQDNSVLSSVVLFIFTEARWMAFEDESLFVWLLFCIFTSTIRIISNQIILFCNVCFDNSRFTSYRLLHVCWHCDCLSRYLTLFEANQPTLTKTNKNPHSLQKYVMSSYAKTLDLLKTCC